MINVATLVGNVGQDPELRYTPKGTPIAQFSLACHERYRDNGGNVTERTHWVRCFAFGKLAQILQQYVHKGSKLGVSGPLNFSRWEDKDGQARSKLELRVRDFSFLDSRPDGREQAPPAEEVDTSEPDEIPF